MTTNTEFERLVLIASDKYIKLGPSAPNSSVPSEIAQRTLHQPAKKIKIAPETRLTENRSLELARQMLEESKKYSEQSQTQEAVIAAQRGLEFRHNDRQLKAELYLQLGIAHSN